MNYETMITPTNRPNKVMFTALIVIGMVLFVFVFIQVDHAWFRFLDARFPNVGTSTGLGTLWGIASRAVWIVFILPMVILKPGFFGFKVGSTFKHYRMLLVMLAVNCGVIAAYLTLTGGTPYSGNQWAITEFVTVPVVEESIWRGLVFTLLFAGFQKIYSAKSSASLSVVLCGLVFGAMHLNNLYAGVPFQFVLIQSLSAMLWGVMYSIARLKTDSVYPSMVLHAAMNLVVILF